MDIYCDIITLGLHYKIVYNFNFSFELLKICTEVRLMLYLRICIIVYLDIKLIFILIPIPNFPIKQELIAITLLYKMCN